MDIRKQLIILILILLCAPVSAQKKEKLVTLKFANIPLSEAMPKVEKQSGYTFFYESQQVDVKQRVSLNVKNETISKTLAALLKGTNIKFDIDNTHIILYTGKNNKDKSESAKGITGTVIDENGEPVIGANVMVVGTTTGVITDLDGKYTINAPAGSRLQISYIGYVTQTVKAGNRNTVKLVEDNNALAEVVVVGYGSQRKSDLTGGIASIDNKKLNMINSSNLMDRLAGQVPGLSVTTGDAAPGADQTLRIRGENSLSASNSPLIVLDGIPYSGSLSDIDPNIIENLSVLKDASAAAIYGSRGANGVILIQSKKGKKEAAKVTYKGQFRISQPQQTVDVMTPEEYITFKQDIARLKDGWSGDQLKPENILSISELVNYQKGVTTDWQDLIFRNAFTMEHQVGISGGTDNTTYMGAISYLDQEGVVENSAMKRYNINLNVTQVLNKWLTIGVQTQFIQRDGGGITPNIEHAVKQSPYGIFLDENGEYYEEPMDQSLIINPFANVKADQDDTRRNFFLNTYADILLPIKGLSARTSFGYNYRSTFTGTYYGRNTKDGRNADGKASINNEHYWDYTWENVLKYNREFGKHRFDATGLFSVQQTQKKTAKSSAESFVNDDSSYHNINAGENKKTVTSSLAETSMLSYMLRLNYSFAGKYMLTVTGRSDGYSAFGKNNKYALFPSVAAAWNIASEEFMEKTNSWMDQLKIRVSYGSNGNQAINPYQTLDRLHLTNYIWGDGSTGVNGVYLPNNGIGNPNLKWETTRTFNIGLDYSFFNGRINGSIEAYEANTKDLLMKRTVPIMNGYKDIMDNVGKTRNKGIEVTLNTVNIRQKDFEWSTSIIFQLNRDKIVDLRGDNKDDITNKWFIGKPLKVYYDYDVKGIWQEGDKYTYIDKEDGKEKEIQKGAKPGSAKLKDANKDGHIDSKDKVVIGSKNPSFYMSMNNTLTYKNFYFSFLLNGTFKVTRELNEANIGSWSYNLYNYLHNANYWTPENPNAKYTSPVYARFDDHSFYKDFTYIQIKNITLGYNFDKNLIKKLGISNLGINLSVENPHTFCDIRSVLNYDTSWFAAYPTARSYVLGLNLTF